MSRLLRLVPIWRQSLRNCSHNYPPMYQSKHRNETDEELANRFKCYFERENIDGWEVRMAMNNIAGLDWVPDPEVICAALRACRRVNEYALTVRFLESVKDKCGSHSKTLYPYILDIITPTMCELGVDAPEDLCYDKPEFWMPSVFHMHGEDPHKKEEC